MHFLYSVKRNTRLILAPLKKIGMGLLSTWVWGNIAESHCITYPLSYGKEFLLSFSVDRRTHKMDPRPHTPILLQKQFICIELPGPTSLQVTNTLRLELDNMFLFFFWKGQLTCGKKLQALAERKFRIRGLNNIFLLELGTWSNLWLYFLKGWHNPPSCSHCWWGVNMS